MTAGESPESGALDQSKRDWSLKAMVPEPPTLKRWRLTTADAIEGPAEELPERVWRWAQAAREESRDE